MAAWDLDMSNPFPSGFTRSFGGPGAGGHSGGGWPVEFGMDLGAPAGTPVHAAYDGRIVSLFLGRLHEHAPPIYGAQIMIRTANGNVQGFYTHIEDLPAAITNGASVSRGDVLGNVSTTTGAAHLHFALAEKVNGTFQGVNLNRFFIDTANTSTVTAVTFSGDGRPQVPAAAPQRQSLPMNEEVYEQPRHLAPMRLQRLAGRIGNRAMGAALASPRLDEAAATLDRPRAVAPAAPAQPAAAPARER